MKWRWHRSTLKTWRWTEVTIRSEGGRLSYRARGSQTPQTSSSSCHNYNKHKVLFTELHFRNTWRTSVHSQSSLCCCWPSTDSRTELDFHFELFPVNHMLDAASCDADLGLLRDRKLWTLSVTTWAALCTSAGQPVQTSLHYDLTICHYISLTFLHLVVNFWVLQNY